MQTKLKNGGSHVTHFCPYLNLRYYFWILTYSYATFVWSILSIEPKVYVLSFELMYDRPSHSASAWITRLVCPTGHL